MVLCDGLGTWTLEADAMTKSVMLFFFQQAPPLSC